jgi:chromosome partitioning protein
MILKIICMMVISMIAQKGGCAKTTSAINIAAALERKGKKVLLIDMDPQGSLTYALGVKRETDRNVATELLRLSEGKEADLLPAIISTDIGLSLVPNSASLSIVATKIRSKMERERFLKRLIHTTQSNYDFVLVDCASASARDLLSQNAIAASNYLLLPVQSEYLCKEALQHFMAELNEILSDKTLNPALTILGMVLTKYEQHKKMHREVFDSLKVQYGDQLFSTWIRSNIEICYAQRHGKDIFSFAPRSHGAEDYLHLAEELLSKISYA